MYLSPARKKGLWQQGQSVVDLYSCRLKVVVFLLGFTCEQRKLITHKGKEVS